MLLFLVILFLLFHRRRWYGYGPHWGYARYRGYGTWYPGYGPAGYGYVWDGYGWQPRYAAGCGYPNGYSYRPYGW